MTRDKKSNADKLQIANRIFESRLMLGTGKYKNAKDALDSINTSQCSIVTVAIRRAKVNQINYISLIKMLNWTKLWLLPNTAGCQNTEDAIRIALLGKELSKRVGQVDNKFIKLEVIPDAEYLFPDPVGTLKAAEYLVKKDFHVLAYTNTDPILAKQLEEVGCSAIMPLASPIGSGQGIQNPFNLSVIVKNAKVPIIIDAGIGTASEASQAMELGADGVLLNTAVAQADSPNMMANAMRLAVKSGRYAYLAGRIQKQRQAAASSPMIDISL